MAAPKSMNILHIGVEIFRSISIENGIKIFKVHEVNFFYFLCILMQLKNYGNQSKPYSGII